MRYIIFIYIRLGAYHLKKLAPQSLKKACASSASCVSRPLKAFAPQCALNNYEFMVYHVSIYRKHLKDFNEEKNLKYFIFYNLFDAYETKVKIKEWFIIRFLY